MNKILGVAAVGALLTASQSAQAQEPDETDEHYAYVFEDDGVLGDQLDLGSMRMTVRTGHLREMLIRPRLHFVPRLLKTAENL